MFFERRLNGMLVSWLIRIADGTLAVHTRSEAGANLSDDGADAVLAAG